MPGYVPPHKRPGYNPSAAAVAAAAPAAAAASRRRGVHYLSEQTGLPTSNLKIHRFAGILANLPAPTRSARATATSRSLARRSVRASAAPRKSAMKGTKKTKRKTRSASPKRKQNRATVRANSR